MPFSDVSACGYSAVLQGVDILYTPHPLHYVHLHSKLVSGKFPVALCAALPIHAVIMLLGNDIAGGKIIPTLEVLDSTKDQSASCDDRRRLLPSCVITRARSRKQLAGVLEGSDVEVGDTLLAKTLMVGGKSDRQEIVKHPLVWVFHYVE